MLRPFILAAILSAGVSHAEVTFDWVSVGDPGNACDLQAQGCFGSVDYEYRVSKYEVTNAQYAEFLNAVAATDGNSLYHTYMANPSPGLFGYGGITRNGSSGSYTYSAIVGRENLPVNYVSFWDAARFANWVHNSQPTGTQDDSTTENGAYRLTPTRITNNTVTRKVGAKAFVPTENEWYKAAYYDTDTMVYFDYPAGSDLQTTCSGPGATANTANCNWVVGDLSNVGSYTGAASPIGTFDQGGNVFEWNDTTWLEERITRGGGFDTDLAPFFVAALFRPASSPFEEQSNLGFRVASRDPPFPQGIPALGAFGLLLVTGGLLGFGVARRGRP